MKFCRFRKFVSDESGATAIEYGLIAALVSIAAITALMSMGTSLEAMFNEVSTHLTNAAPDAGGGGEGAGEGEGEGEGGT